MSKPVSPYVMFVWENKGTKNIPKRKKGLEGIDGIKGIKGIKGIELRRASP